MTDEAMIEKIARAICAARDGEDEGYIITTEYDRELAQAAAAVLSEAMAERDKAIAEWLLKVANASPMGSGRAAFYKQASEAIASGEYRKEPT